jgi:hypothetical protein
MRYDEKVAHGVDTCVAVAGCQQFGVIGLHHSVACKCAQDHGYFSITLALNRLQSGHCV